MFKENSLSNSVLKVTAFDIISKVFSIVISILLIRILTIRDYATFTFFNSISSFVYGIIGSSLSLAFVKFYVEQSTRKNDRNKGIFFFTIILIIFIHGLLFLIIPLAKRLLNISDILIIISILYGLTLSLNQLNQAYYQARELYSKSGIISNIKYFFILIYLMFLFFIIGRSKINQVMIGYIFFTALSFFIGIYFIYKSGEKLFNVKLSNFSSMISESIWIIIYTLILNMFNQADIFMINRFLGDVDVSNYGVAFKYYSIALTLLSSIQMVLRVKTSSHEMIDNENKQREFTINWIKKVLPFSSIITVMAIVASWFIFPIVNGSQYNNSILTFNILMVGAGISYITAPNINIMRASGKHKLLCLIAFGALCINLIGNYLFIPAYGINAAAVTTIVSQFFLNGIATFVILYKKSKICLVR